MALTAKRLYSSPNTGMPTSLTTLYTAPAVTKTRLTSMVLCNASGAGRTYRLYLVPSGGSAATGNAIYGFDFSLPPGIPVPIPLNDWLNTGDFIHGIASGAD